MISSFHRVVAAVYVGLGCCMVDCSLRDENQRQPENETVKLNTTSSLPLEIKDPEKQPVKIRVMPEQVAKYSVGELFVAADSKVGRWKVRMIATDGYGVANSTHFTLVTNFLSGKIATTPGFESGFQLQFKSNFTPDFRWKAMWDFGDETSSQELNPIRQYKILDIPVFTSLSHPLREPVNSRTGYS